MSPFGTAILAMVLLFGGMLTERILLGLRWAPYFRLGLPLRRRPAPISTLPKGVGATATVGWAVSSATVQWWGSRAAPMGLHGCMLLDQREGKIEIHVRWAPPWTIWLAALWLMGLGVFRGEASLTIPVGAMMILGTAVVYWRAAVLAADELREAFSRGVD